MAHGWQARDSSPAGNDGENGESSSEEEQICASYVQVSEITACCLMNWLAAAGIGFEAIGCNV